MSDVLATENQLAEPGREPLLVLEPLAEFLEAAGLGNGPSEARLIGDGHSNVTYEISRRGQRLVLRCPPRGPLPPSAHDVLRECRLLAALATAGARVPPVLATCEDLSVIGAPFYITEFIEGEVLTTELPAAFADSEATELIAHQLVDSLVDIHAIDVESAGLTWFGRSDGYLERQVRRFRGLLADNATRPLPELEQVAEWLDRNRPPASETTVVHGDYHLGNVIVSSQTPPRLAAILDWEMATIGDPLADLGYLTAMWAETDDPTDPMLELSPVTRLPGFPTRAQLTERYARRSGRDPARLVWYQTLAVWKAAIFLEGSYRRFLAGTTDDEYFARLGVGVPALARRALRTASLDSNTMVPRSPPLQSKRPPAQRRDGANSDRVKRSRERVDPGTGGTE